LNEKLRLSGIAGGRWVRYANDRLLPKLEACLASGSLAVLELLDLLGLASHLVRSWDYGRKMQESATVLEARTPRCPAQALVTLIT
jgi:hypothetical protein